ncbi:DNA/RNA non-specific endonuclease [Streptomyces sp. NPDC050421]|uniref:DNA/RNA non-specific endonuclease n=1 Tax=unclassified Streptomyces TaxID=2593676 RepID=UPI00378B55C6
MLNTPDTEIMGSPAPWPPKTPGFFENAPPGFVLGNDPTLNRGHLLARQLGGSGTDRRNLVTLYRNANAPVMSKQEDKIADSIAAGNTVYYSAVPVWGSDSNPIPLGVTMTAYTSSGARIVDQTIWNKP